MYLLNAFSLNMIPDNYVGGNLAISPLTVEEVKYNLKDGFKSAVGHADTAKVFSSVLELTVECNRCNVVLDPAEFAIVGQYVGPRLPEGATTLPEGATIKWFRLRLLTY